MKKEINKQYSHIIFGLGQSGLSCARYFERISQEYCIVDTRKHPIEEKQLVELKYCQDTFFGEINEDLLRHCKQLIVSPGISLSHDFVKKAKSMEIDVCGDVEIFSRICKKKIVAITGSNGKSTVTDLLDKLLLAAGINSQKGGNIGLPVLDFLPEDKADVYVLELSSFQLDSTYSLAPSVAVLLNISEDHMDRYQSFEEYVSSKRKIFVHAKYSVYNYDEVLTHPSEISNRNISFSYKEPMNNESNLHCFLKKNGVFYDLFVDEVKIISTDKLNITGSHNWLNILACCGILTGLGIKIKNSILSAIKEYSGLPHRFQLVSRAFNCEWINDSKATNVGASVTAINSINLSNKHRLVLIAGGDSKKSDLTPLREPLKNKVNYLILLGKDAQKIANLVPALKIDFVNNMFEAVDKAKKYISDGDVVLLSPACASLDMYKNFEDRGNTFIEAVKRCA